MSQRSVPGDSTAAAVRWFLRFKQDDVSTLSSEEVEAWANWSEEPERLERFRVVTKACRRLHSVRPLISIPSETELAADSYDESVPIAQWLAESTRSTRVPADVRVRRSWRSSRSVKVLALAAGLAALAIAAVQYPYREHLLRFGAGIQTYTTSSSERRLIRLPDGSTITLAPRTELSTHYTDDRRDIVLEHGEAWFSVAADPTRPCTVFAGSGAITVLGTQFDVRREKDASDVEHVTVTVSNGAVEVGPPPSGPIDALAAAPNEGSPPKWEPAKLVQGQELTFDATGPRGGVKVADLGAAAAWREGRLEFRHTPLKLVIPQVNQYSDKPIVLEGSDDTLGELPFSGTIFEHRIPGWLHALEAAYPVKVTETPDSFVIHAR